jgi:hypothetical protein
VSRACRVLGQCVWQQVKQSGKLPRSPKYNPKLVAVGLVAAGSMGAVDKGKLDSKVADDLLMDASVVQLMENPKLSAAIARLKEEPGCFQQMCADDPELGELPCRNQARHGRPAQPSS